MDQEKNSENPKTASGIEDKAKVALSHVEKTYGKANDLVKGSKFQRYFSFFAKISDWLASGKIFRLALAIVVYGGGLLAAWYVCKGWAYPISKINDFNFTQGLTVIITLILSLPCIILSFAHWFRQGHRIVPSQTSDVMLLPGLSKIILAFSESVFIFLVSMCAVLLVTTLLSPEIGNLCIGILTLGSCAAYDEITRAAVWLEVIKAPLVYGLSLLIICRFIVEMLTLLLAILARLDAIKDK